MFVSVHYVENVSNVKTNRCGIIGHIYCLSHFLTCKIIIHTNTFYTFYAIFINFILYVNFIVHVVTVFFCMQINKYSMQMPTVCIHVLAALHTETMVIIDICILNVS